jgi:hypothetical protein
MATIKLPERNLVARTNTLHLIFAPLRGANSRTAVEIAKDSPGGTIALVARDQKSDNSLYREESFRTFKPGLRCKYFELWRDTGGNAFDLNRAYFTLLNVLPTTHEFKELLCIHTDPGDVDDLKQGPHLHVSCAPDPMQRCHFPLEFGNLPIVLKDCDSLTNAMERAIGVIARDVLPRF